VDLIDEKTSKTGQGVISFTNWASLPTFIISNLNESPSPFSTCNGEEGAFGDCIALKQGIDVVQYHFGLDKRS
jgi:hypothetical protein